MATYWTPPGFAQESDHFATYELACPSCGVCAIRPELLTALEDLRRRVGRPIELTSAFRCPRHNAEVGGAESSQHMYGLAVDLAFPVDSRPVAQCRAFSGIGMAGGLVRHVDMRHLDPATNWTGSGPSDPAIWHY